MATCLCGVILSGRNKQCSACKKAKLKERKEEYKRPDVEIAPERDWQAADEWTAEDQAQVETNLAVDRAVGARVNVPIESAMARRFIRGAEWLMA